MKSIFTTLTFSFMMAFCIGTTAYAVPVNDITPTEVSTVTAQDVINMTPKQFEEMTGTKMTLKQKIGLKAAQLKMKKANNSGSDDDDKILMYILCFVLPPLAVALTYDIGKEFWVNIILTLLCGVPGVIHALVVISKYYK